MSRPAHRIQAVALRRQPFASIQQVRSTVAGHLAIPVAVVRGRHRLREDLGLDQLDLVLLAMKMEPKFRVELPFYLMQTLQTVQEVADWIDDLMRREERAPTN